MTGASIQILSWAKLVGNLRKRLLELRPQLVRVLLKPSLFLEAGLEAFHRHPLRDNCNSPFVQEVFCNCLGKSPALGTQMDQGIRALVAARVLQVRPARFKVRLLGVSFCPPRADSFWS